MSLEDHARFYQGANSDELASDFQWSEIDLEVNELHKYMPNGWDEWLKDELKFELEEGRFLWSSIKKDDLIKEPIVLTDHTIWDGWHRAAIAVVNGHKTIKAIFGTVRNIK